MNNVCFPADPNANELSRSPGQTEDRFWLTLKHRECQNECLGMLNFETTFARGNPKWLYCLGESQERG